MATKPLKKLKAIDISLLCAQAAQLRMRLDEESSDLAKAEVRLRDAKAENKKALKKIGVIEDALWAIRDGEATLVNNEGD